MTLRRLAVLIKYLPDDSALAIASNGGKRPWSLGDYLLSDLWALQARGIYRNKAPDAHPWRAEINKAASARRSRARRSSLMAAQQRHGRHRRVAGR